LVGGHSLLYVAGFGILSVLLECSCAIRATSRCWKWLSLSLFAYVATLFAVNGELARCQATTSLCLDISLKGQYLMVVVAVFGTTISPYLFSGSAGEEVEAEREIRVPIP